MEQSDNDEFSSQRSSSPRNPLSTGQVLLLLVVLFALGVYWLGSSSVRRSTIGYSFFLKQLEAGNVQELKYFRDRELHGKFLKPPLDPEAQLKPDAKGQAPALEPDFLVVTPPMDDPALLAELKKREIDFEVESSALGPGVGMMYLVMLIPLVMVVVFWFMFSRLRDQMMGGGGSGGILGNFSKSPAKRYEPSGTRVTFDDVAGLETVKSELEELVEYLKSPVKFQRLGGRIPKGTLLMGPPGTGKTLLAKAVAGEANVPFYSINGSEFIQMFVGVGAGRVRDLFRTAKQTAPCILFIDEIDAVGRVRGAGFGGGHDEREQTLNQILSEMDGFSPNESVIVVAATNRPDVLDPALLRPGRFDRHITVDRPTMKGRLAMFKVHTRKVPLSDDVSMERLAAATIGLTGADIRNLVNEAALWATRQDKSSVGMVDFEYAQDKVLMGPKRDEVLNPREKELTAYHEAGHALLAWMLPGVDRVHKVSVIPRGRALGVTQMLPEEDRVTISEDALHARLACLLGGRAAERLVYSQHNAGAEDDLKRATQLARRMVTHWGMSERLGPIAFRTSEENPFLGLVFTEQRDFSDHTARVIDEEVARILHMADEQARELLQQHRDKLDALAKALVRDELLNDSDIESLIGPAVGKQSRALAEPKNQKSDADRDPQTATLGGVAGLNTKRIAANEVDG